MVVGTSPKYQIPRSSSIAVLQLPDPLNTPYRSTSYFRVLWLISDVQNILLDYAANSVIPIYLYCIRESSECAISLNCSNMAPFADLEYFRLPPRWLFVKITDTEGNVGWGEATLEGVSIYDAISATNYPMHCMLLLAF